jgi:DNA replication initiation complex subunit (GINS family)
METVLTFQYLRELQKKEKESNELQEIDPNFYGFVREYLSRKKRIAMKDALKSFTEQRKLENTKAVIKYIIDRREQKIVLGAIQAAHSDIKLKNMLEEEEMIFNKIRDLIKKQRERLENLFMEEKEEQEEPKEIKSLKLKFLSNTSAFVDDDLKEYGPFKNEDIAEIPRKIAEILIKNKNAVMLNESS